MRANYASSNIFAMETNLIEPSALFPSPPHLTQASILWSNEQFYKVDYEDQICLSWPNLIAWQFSLQWDNANSSFDYKKLQMGGKGKRAEPSFTPWNWCFCEVGVEFQFWKLILS